MAVFFPFSEMGRRPNFRRDSNSEIQWLTPPTHCFVAHLNYLKWQVLQEFKSRSVSRIAGGARKGMIEFLILIRQGYSGPRLYYGNLRNRLSMQQYSQENILISDLITNGSSSRFQWKTQPTTVLADPNSYS
jgi:hypothetical protein